MSTEAAARRTELQEATEHKAKESLQATPKAPETPVAPAGGEEQPQQQTRPEQQQQAQQKKHRTFAEVVAAGGGGQLQQPPTQQPQQRPQRQPQRKESEKESQRFEIGHAGEAGLGPEQPREKELEHFKKTPTERQLQKQATQQEETERQRRMSEQEKERKRESRELRSESTQDRDRTRKMENEEQRRRVSDQNESRQRFVIARKLSSGLAQEGKISEEQAKELKNIGESENIDERTGKILRASEGELGGQPQPTETWKEDIIIHETDAELAKQEEEKERQKRLKDQGYSQQREKAAHQVAQAFAQQSVTTEAAEQPLWKESVVVHETDAELAKQEEEKERQRRAKGEVNLERQREQVAHQVAEVFKHEREAFQNAPSQRYTDTWMQDREVHEIDSELAAQEEERERQRRMKNEGGIEKQRERLAHEMAQTFKEEEESKNLQRGAPQEATRYVATFSSRDAQCFVGIPQERGSPVASGGYQQQKEKSPERQPQQEVENLKDSMPVIMAQAMREEQGLGARYPEMINPAKQQEYKQMNIETEEYEVSGPRSSSSSTGFFGGKQQSSSQKSTEIKLPELDVAIDIKEHNK